MPHQYQTFPLIYLTYSRSKALHEKLNLWIKKGKQYERKFLYVNNISITFSHQKVKGREERFKTFVTSFLK